MTLTLVPDDPNEGKHVPPGPPPPMPPAPSAPASPLAPAVYTMVNGTAVDTMPGARPPEPIIPEWMRTHHGRRATVVNSVRRWRYVTLWHATRAHVHWGRLAKRSPHGVLRGLAVAWRWAWDYEGKETLEALRKGVGGAGLERAHRDHRTAMRNRWMGVAVGTLALRYAAAYWLTLTTLPRLGALCVVLPTLGVIGRDQGKPIIERLIFNGVETPKVSESLVIHALLKARIPGVEKAYKESGDHAFRWVKPPHRTAKGYACIVDLPDGITIDDVAAKKGALASGMSRPSSTVWVDGLRDEDGGHDGRLRLVATDTPMRGFAMPPMPLTGPTAGPISIWDPIPFGVDYMGDPVELSLLFMAMIIGALPRMGKTFSMREILLCVALDPTVEIHAFDLKGGADFDVLGRGRQGSGGVCHTFASGQDQATALLLVATLHYLVRDMERRYRLIRDLTDLGQAPGKVAANLAANKAYGLHPVVLAIDETQTCFADWPKEIAAECTELVTILVKKGPAAGIILLLATQNVDSTTIPTPISRMASGRFCLRVTDHTASEQILGTGTYKRGFQASNLSLDDKGIGYLGGDGEATRLVRVHEIDGPEMVAMVARARKLRADAGRLTGMAAGIEPQIIDADGLVEHLYAWWPMDGAEPAKKEHCSILADTLAENMPTAYSELTGGLVTSQLTAAGIKTSRFKLHGSKSPVTGVAYADLAAAVEKRAAERPTPELDRPTLELIEGEDDDR